MTGEQLPPPTLETMFDHLSNLELVQRFVTQDESTAPEDLIRSQIVMGRLLKELDRVEIADYPLLNAGEVVEVLDGKELAVIDYLEIADRHGMAKNMMLNFLCLEKTHEKYKSFREILLDSVDAHVGVRSPEIA